MLILTIRSDKPDAEVGLCSNGQKLAYDTWLAHRQLAETLHRHIRDVLMNSGKTFQDLEGLAVYAGPGSFTGLRIGLSVANALAYSLGLPIMATAGADWIMTALAGLQSGSDDKVALPEYGLPATITIPKR